MSRASIDFWWHHLHPAVLSEDDSPIPGPARNLQAEQFIDMLVFSWDEPANEGDPPYDQHYLEFKVASEASIHPVIGRTRAQTMLTLTAVFLDNIYTLSEVDEVFTFTVHARQSATLTGGLPVDGTPAVITARLLPMPTSPLTGSSALAGGLRVDINTTRDDDATIDDYEWQVRLDTATDWDAANLVSGITAEVLPPLFESQHDRILRLSGFTPATGYDIRLRRVLRNSTRNDAVWRASAWSSHTSSTTAAAVTLTFTAASTDVLVGRPRAFRLVYAVAGLTTPSGVADDYEAQYQPSGETDWTDIGITAVTVLNNVISVETDDVPDAGGTFLVRLRMPEIAPTWVPSSTTVTFPSLLPHWTWRSGFDGGRIMQLRITIGGVWPDGTPSLEPMDWEVEISNDGQTTWVEGMITGVGLSTGSTTNYNIDVMALKEGGTFRARLRYPGQVDDFVLDPTSFGPFGDVQNVPTITQAGATAGRKLQIDGTYTNSNPREMLTDWQIQYTLDDGGSWIDIETEFVNTLRGGTAGQFRVRSVEFPLAGGTGINTRVRLRQDLDQYSDWSRATNTVDISDDRPTWGTNGDYNSNGLPQSDLDADRIRYSTQISFPDGGTWPDKEHWEAHLRPGNWNNPTSQDMIPIRIDRIQSFSGVSVIHDPPYGQEPFTGHPRVRFTYRDYTMPWRSPANQRAWPARAPALTRRTDNSFSIAGVMSVLIGVERMDWPGAEWLPVNSVSRADRFEAEERHNGGAWTPIAFSHVGESIDLDAGGTHSYSLTVATSAASGETSQIRVRTRYTWDDSGTEQIVVGAWYTGRTHTAP